MSQSLNIYQINWILIKINTATNRVDGLTACKVLSIVKKQFIKLMYIQKFDRCCLLSWLLPEGSSAGIDSINNDLLIIQFNSRYGLDEFQIPVFGKP